VFSAQPKPHASNIRIPSSDLLRQPLRSNSISPKFAQKVARRVSFEKIINIGSAAGKGCFAKGNIDVVFLLPTHPHFRTAVTKLFLITGAGEQSSCRSVKEGKPAQYH
jgi:hypothetical protein